MSLTISTKYDIHADVDQLIRVSSVDAPLAVIFYCARILEILLGEIESQLFGAKSAQCYASLKSLYSSGFLSDTTLRYCNILRILGNDVRHNRRPVDTSDADSALIFLNKSLAWYSGGQYAWSVNQEVIIAYGKLPLASNIIDVIDDIDILMKNGSKNTDIKKLMGKKTFFTSPVFSAIVSEQLIAEGNDKIDDTIELLQHGLTCFPTDIRLRQLLGWAHRLKGNYQESQRILEDLREEGPQNDPETNGLLAALYKRLWQWQGKPPVEGEKKYFSTQAVQLYTSVWKSSGEKDAYTGINAATMSLLLGDTDRAQQIAGTLIKLYEKRRGIQAPGRMISFSGYWDRVILAEALLIAGEIEESRRQYKNALTLYSHWKTYTETTLEQLKMLLPAIGINYEVERFLDSPCEKNQARKEKKTMYKPAPIDTSNISLPKDLHELREVLAENIHETWASNRINQGWKFGPERDDKKLEHPDLLPYDELSEAEKDYDRHSADETIKVLLKLGYRIEK